MSRSHGQVRVALAAVGVTAVLAGCSAPFMQESPGGRIAVAGEATDAQPQALAEGTAEWGEGGCIVIHGEAINLVIFPRGTTLDDNDQVTLPNGYRLRAGYEVGLGGGYRSGDATKRDLSAIPDECLTGEVFWASGEVAE